MHLFNYEHGINQNTIIMKKFLLHFIFIMAILPGFSQTPLTLTFQAKDSLTQSALALDSVKVTNLTESCDTTLYGAVPVLTVAALWPVGIDDPATGSSESFTVMQNSPNPFRGSTLVRIYMKNAGELNLFLNDNQGKLRSEYHHTFEKGWHLFGVSASNAQLMFLNVSDNKTTRTIKLLSTGEGNDGDRISYKGMTGQVSILKSSPDASNFIFYLGNQLQYTAYSGGYHESVLTDNPVSSETYSFAMLPAVFTCGSSFTINHVAGDVAPVNKTVTYGTVTNIPGEPSKCWITSNLGADHQATGKDDFTEASAGWYWQFNRKQGYKHDGIVRTPNSTWISSINENVDWTPSLDPCALELGNGWRLATQVEWTNLDASGNWTNWDGPWSSALKLHAAGILDGTTGALVYRGSDGKYWSSNQFDAQNGRILSFVYNLCGMFLNSKTNGFPVRCVRE
jgi:hypothetical protein